MGPKWFTFILAFTVYTRPWNEGINPEYIINFLNACEKHQSEIHGIAIAVHDRIIFEAYNAPYNAQTPHIMHSFTKILTNTAVGLAFGDGLLQLDDPVLKYFPEQVVSANNFLKKCTIRDLLTMRNGQERSIGGNEWRPLKTSWKQAYFQVPFDKEPGKTFMYSSGNSYILSYLVQQVERKTAAALFQDRIGEKIGIKDFPWMMSPEGVCSGGNGVELKVTDMLRLGILYLHKGNWQGEQLLPAEWVDYAFGYRDPIPPVEGKQYNFHWERKSGQDIWAAKGMFGQICGVIPKYDMVFAITAADKTYSTEDLFQKEILDKINASRKKMAPLKEPVMEKILHEKGLRLSLLDHDHSVDKHIKLPKSMVFYPEKNPDHIQCIQLIFKENTFYFRMRDNRGFHEIKHGLDYWVQGTTSMTGAYLHHQYEKECLQVWAEGHWTDATTLLLKWRYPEMAFFDQVKICFQKEQVIINRWVNMNSQDICRPTLVLKNHYHA